MFFGLVMCVIAVITQAVQTRRKTTQAARASVLRVDGKASDSASKGTRLCQMFRCCSCMPSGEGSEQSHSVRGEISQGRRRSTNGTVGARIKESPVANGSQTLRNQSPRLVRKVVPE